VDYLTRRSVVAQYGVPVRGRIGTRGKTPLLTACGPRVGADLKVSAQEVRQAFEDLAIGLPLPAGDSLEALAVEKLLVAHNFQEDTLKARAGLFMDALAVLRDPTKSTAWCRAPLHVLGGRAPWDAPEEARLVLGRLEHGVFG
jgi:hypothetical protein